MMTQMIPPRLLRPSGRVQLPDGPPLEPVSAGAAVAALRELARPGAARWAVAGWAVDLVGPWRSLPRCADDGTSSRAALEELLTQLAPGAAREVLPEWIGQTSADVDVLLSLGEAAGKPGRRLMVDIPKEAAGLVVDIGDGLVRFLHPCWRGDPLSSDGRLLALRELAAGGGVPDAVRVLASWCVGPSRADVGTWARRNPGRALPGESTTPGARRALPGMVGLDVAAVTEWRR